MKISRSLVSIPVLFVVTLGGCHSNSNPPATQPNASTPQPTASTTPGQQPPATAATSSQPAQAAPAPAAPAPPAAVELAAGTHLRIRLDQDLGSKISESGDKFRATIANDVTVDGTTVIARGARAEGTVVDAKPLGRFKGGARLELRLDRVHTQWGSYPVATGTIERAEKGKGKRSAEFIGGGAGFGALLGGLAGGGKGAAIGALAGGGAGTAGSAFTGNKQIVLPAETLLSFRLERPVHITQQP